MNMHSQAKVKVYYCKCTLNPTSHFYESAHTTLLVQTTCFVHCNSLQGPPCYTIYLVTFGVTILPAVQTIQRRVVWTVNNKLERTKTELTATEFAVLSCICLDWRNPPNKLWVTYPENDIWTWNIPNTDHLYYQLDCDVRYFTVYFGFKIYHFRLQLKRNNTLHSAHFV